MHTMFCFFFIKNITNCNQFSAGVLVAKFEMFKNAQNSIIWPFTNFQFCPRAHQQKIGHQCKRQHEPQDNSFAFSHKQREKQKSGSWSYTNSAYFRFVYVKSNLPHLAATKCKCCAEQTIKYSIAVFCHQIINYEDKQNKQTHYLLQIKTLEKKK